MNGQDTTNVRADHILGGDVFVYRLNYNGVEMGQGTLRERCPSMPLTSERGLHVRHPPKGYSNERLQSIWCRMSDGKGHQTACFLNGFA